MNKSLQLWQFIAKQLKQDHHVMLLLVAESSGSSPGRQGFKMAVSEDHTFEGSIGGGIMEVKLTELAKEMLKKNISSPQIKKQIHRKSAPRDQSGMICSGEQTVIYFRLEPHHLPEVEKIITLLSNYSSAYLHIKSDGKTPVFNIEEGISHAPEFLFEKKGEDEFTWKEYIGYRQQLYIVGGGHCALALSGLMSKFDFYIHVIDDRPDLNTLDQNIFVHKKHLVENYDQIGDLIPSGPDVFVVVMTLGYRSDLIVLLQLASKTFAYLGLLGSESKVNTLKEELIKNNYPKSLLEEMHAPIGLKINSHTPEEIAVSIAAELIKVKNELHVSD
ncbi:MAG TPA: XdhC family protein [Saprospiraceae bacterium]|nr:XdhC family protein [Saprospiraceae bacterium]